MSTRIKLLLALSLTAGLTTGLAACGGPDVAEPAKTLEQSDAALTSEARTTLPPLVSLRDWNPDRAFVPSYRVSSHFVTEIARSPDDPAHFRAYGSDSQTRQIFFQVDGTFENDLTTFLGAVGKQAAGQGLAAQGVGLKYSFGIAGEVHGPIPIGPGPIGGPDGLARRILSFARSIEVAIARAIPAQAP
jgi:hypothetical protein